jgi:tetratricopeptide (TPR) repeat protein
MLREGLQVLEALAEQAPVVLVLEDLHWADEATLELLAALTRRARPARLLVVATLQPGERASGALLSDALGRRSATEVPLGPLDVAAVAAGLAARLGAARVVPALAGVLHERSDGNPLFAGLIADHWIAEQDVAVRDDAVVPARDIGALAVTVPPTIRGSVEVKLARLRPVDREVLEAAAVAGDPFTAADVAAATGHSLADVYERLAALARHRVVDQREQDAFGFAHGLHRDVLLDVMGAARRTTLHRRLGGHLELAPDGADRASRVALHLIEGGDPVGGVRFLRLGAERALARSAYGIAVRHLRRALEVVADLPEDASRRRAELELLSMLGQALVGREGWADREAEGALLQARDLADRLGDNEPRLSVLLTLATLYEVRGEIGQAGELMAQARALAPDWPHDGALESHELLACNLFHQGAFVRALEHADRGAAAFDANGADGAYATFPGTLGDNAGVACHDWAALALWFLGYPDQALERARRAVGLAGDPVRRYSLAAACAQLAAVHQCRGEPERVRHWADVTLEVAGEQGYAFRCAAARVMGGWASVRLGDADAGLEELMRGLAAARSTGALMHESLHLAMLADAYLQVDEPEAALEAAEDGLAQAARQRSAFFEPELERLRAVALLRGDAPAEAVQAALDAAIRLARRQGSRSLELRAAVTQARFWAGSNRAAAGRAAVAAVAERFREGLDTPDLQAAAQVLGRAYPAPTGR